MSKFTDRPADQSQDEVKELVVKWMSPTLRKWMQIKNLQKLI